MTVSALGHAIVLGALALLAGSWNSNPSKVYVVNLVAGLASPSPGPPHDLKPLRPAAPAARPTPLSSPPKSSEPAKLPPLPPAAKPETQPSIPTALSRLEERKPPLPPRPVEPARPRELPLTALSRLEERKPPLPPRPVEPPRPRELPLSPRHPGETEKAPPPSVPERAGTPAEGFSRPAARQPEPSTGMSAVSAEVSDFPFTWYLSRVQRKVAERWADQLRISEPAERPLIFVEILRDGSIHHPRVEKSSGNTLYDQAAVRAVTEASPFPPLPQEWSRPTLRILFGFELQARRG